MRHSRIVTLLFLACSCAFLSGCHNDDEATGPQTLLTVQVDDQYAGLEDSDPWIFATDENGQLLDVKPYAAGQTVTLSSDKRPNKINVTFFKYVDQLSTGTDISFNTWVGITPGVALHFVAPTVSSGGPDPQRVNATINISNTQSAGGSIGLSNYKGYSAGSSSASGNLEIDLGFYPPDDVLVYGWRSEEPVYNWILGAKANDVITRDFNTDFTPYPHQFKLNFEGQNFAQIIGYDSQKPYGITLLDTYRFTQSGHPTIGYLDGYDYYLMSVTNIKDTGTTYYYKTGDIDFPFDMAAFTFSMTNSDIQNFSFNFSRNYTYHSATWQYLTGTEHMRWTVIAPSGQSVTGLSIPPEIAAKYPQLDMDKFTYAYMSMTEVLQGRKYPEFMPGMPAAKAGEASESYVYSPR